MGSEVTGRGDFWAVTLRTLLSPQYFLYKFPQDVDSVIIKVVSDAVYPCSVVSVQDIVVSLSGEG